MPGKEKLVTVRKKRMNDGHSKREKDDQRSPSPPPLRKRRKIGQPKLDKNNDQSVIGSSKIPLIHLNDLALDEVKNQMNTFSRLQLATVNRRFTDILRNQGKDVHVRLNVLLNNIYTVNIRDGSGVKTNHKIDHNKLTAFLKSIFQRLKQLRTITTCYGVPELGYCSLLRALMCHQVKVHRLHLRDEALTLIKAKWKLLSYCAPKLHTLALWQSAGMEPICGMPPDPWECYEAKFATERMQAFEKCAKLRRFRLVGWLTPATIDCIGQLKQLHHLALPSIFLLPEARLRNLLAILAKNNQLRHLAVPYGWERVLASSHAASLFCQLKSFGFAISQDCSLRHFTAITLPTIRHQLLDLLAMLGPDGRVNIEISFHRLFSADCSLRKAEKIIKNFITFWLQLSGSAGGSVIVLKFLYDFHGFIYRLLLTSVGEVPIQLKPTYPSEWKIEQDPRGKKHRYSIQCHGGSVGLRRLFEE